MEKHGTQKQINEGVEMKNFIKKLKEIDDYIWKTFEEYNTDDKIDWNTWMIDELDTVITFWGIDSNDKEVSKDIPIEVFNKKSCKIFKV